MRCAFTMYFGFAASDSVLVFCCVHENAKNTNVLCSEKWKRFSSQAIDLYRTHSDVILT